MLTIRKLAKTYSNGKQALANVNLDLQPGIFGLLGKNGAGKSTLMRTLATLQLPDEGSAMLNDIDLLNDPLRARRHIGYLPQDMGTYPLMSALETLNYFIGLKGLNDRVDPLAALERVNLADVAHQRLDTFSGGMQRRFGIAVAFLGNPELVIVDEPTAGLDPFERRRFQQLLAEAARECILILSTHIVEDVENLAQQMMILHEGRVAALGEPEQLMRELDGCIWTHEVGFDELEDWRTQTQVLASRPRPNGHLIRVYAPESPGASFNSAPPDLEDVYAHRIANPGA
ncbi:MAG: ATP-binding cassette domain-containing protein [Pseudomonadota bacterium]